MKRTILFLSVIGLAAGLSTAAQQLRPPVTSDFGQWEALALPAARGPAPLSPDGKWIAYGINRSDRNNELRIANVASGDTAVAAFGDQPAFSADSRWIAYGSPFPKPRRRSCERRRSRCSARMGLRNLATGEAATLTAPNPSRSTRVAPASR